MNVTKQLSMDEQWGELLRRFFVPDSIQHRFANLDNRIATLESDYVDLAKAFRHNLETIHSSISLPFILASASVTEGAFTRLFAAERIRTLKPGPDCPGGGPDSSSERDRAAQARAKERYLEYVSSPEGRSESALGIRRFLLGAVERGALGGADGFLVEQCSVMLWTAFEVVIRGMLECFLNRHPDKFALIASDPSSKRRIEARYFSLEVLLQHNFDLSKSVGTILATDYDFSDLPTIKSLLSAVFPSDEALRKSLSDPTLWLLFQRRHLFVHRAGVVDKRYLDRTGDSVALGTRLTVSPSDFEASFKSVLGAGEALLTSLVGDK